MEIKDIIDTLNQFKAERAPIESGWQKVANLVDTTKADFIQNKDSSFTNQDLYDKTASLSLNIRSSTLNSLLWDSGKFAYRPNQKYFPDKADLNDFFQYATEIAQREFKKAEADRIFFESEMDEAAFGPSYVYLGAEDGLNLIPFQVKECYINETIKGKIDTVYRLYCITVKQCIDTFGEENVTDKVRQLYTTNKLNEKIEILHVIQPRSKRSVLLKGKENMPFESIYIETNSKKEMKKQGIQGGFPYFPIYVSREGKRNGEKYAYSVSMMAIEEISQLNVERENQIIVDNRFADPSIWYDATALQGNILDTSPGSATAFRMTGRAGTPVGNMVTIQGDPNSIENSIVRLQETIGKFYAIDRLLDFNNDTQMTLGESQIRARIRQQTLGATLSKKRSEKYEPIVKRAFQLLLDQDKFGYMPDDIRIAEDEALGLEPRIIPEEIINLINAGIDPLEFIDVRFYTQFELEKQLLENNTILQVWNNAGLISQLTQSPNVFDNLDEDKTIKAIGDVSFNIDIFKDKKEVAQIRNDRTTKNEVVEGIEGARAISEIGKNQRA